MKPVAANATFWLTLSFSAGRERSLTPAMTRAHFAVREGLVWSGRENWRSVPTGAQKKIVLWDVRIFGVLSCVKGNVLGTYPNTVHQSLMRGNM